MSTLCYSVFADGRLPCMRSAGEFCQEEVHSDVLALCLQRVYCVFTNSSL